MPQVKAPPGARHTGYGVEPEHYNGSVGDGVDLERSNAASANAFHAGTIRQAWTRVYGPARRGPCRTGASDRPSTIGRAAE